MLQDIDNTEDLTALVEKMLASMRTRLQVMSDVRANHVAAVSTMIEELEASFQNQEPSEEQGLYHIPEFAQPDDVPAQQRPESGGPVSR